MDLETLYNNIKLPSGLAGENQLYKTAKAVGLAVTREAVKLFLRTKDAYTLHVNARRRFPRRKIIAPKPGIILSMDLADMTKLSRYNNNYKYLLVVIDSFSRYLRVQPLKNKTGLHVLKALKLILTTPEFKTARRIQSDKGTEFYNARVLAYLKSRDITLYSVSSYEIKASIAERVIRTLKSKLYKYLTHKNTLKYINVLPQITTAYNSTVHSTLGKTPTEVHQYTSDSDIKSTFQHLYKKAYPRESNVSSKPYPVGSTVRLSLTSRGIFKRGYTTQNTVEIFKISAIDQTQTPAVYKIKDLAGEAIEGIFYKAELIPTALPSTFSIRILKRKKINRKKLMFFVTWIGFPAKFNTWINAADVVKS